MTSWQELYILGLEEATMDQEVVPIGWRRLGALEMRPSYSSVIMEQDTIIFTVVGKIEKLE